MFESIVAGFINLASLDVLLAISFGILLGLAVGAMPGLSATMAIALLLPITFTMDPAPGISMLASLYIGALYGGSIPAILLKTPGTPSAAATILDGFPMAVAGNPGKALGISLASSVTGGIIGAIFLITAAPVLARFAIRFGPPENFALAIFGLSLMASLAKGSTIKGLLSGFVGLFIAMVGMELTTGYPRFTFGIIQLYDGVPYVAALIGLFSISQALVMAETKSRYKNLENISITDRMLPTFKEYKKIFKTIFKSGIIGTIIGMIPGTGGDIATWVSYNEARRTSKEPEKFGEGHPEGIASSEAANNAVGGGALIPVLALGIPGSAATAMLMGGLLVHGFMPGPRLMTQHAEMSYTLLAAVFLAQFVLFGIGLMFTKAALYITKVSNAVVAPLIVVLSVVGAFAVSSQMFDAYLMFGFGIMGYFMTKIKIPLAPMVLGIILGPIADTALAQTLRISTIGWWIFFTRPISLIMLALALLSIIGSMTTFKLSSIFTKIKKMESGSE